MTCCYKGCTREPAMSSLLCAEHSLTDEGQMLDQAAAMLMKHMLQAAGMALPRLPEVTEAGPAIPPEALN